MPRFSNRRRLHAGATSPAAPRPAPASSPFPKPLRVLALAKWLGVSDADIPAVVPNIARFPSRDLGFMA
jgi:hypothetical protein